MFPRYSLRWLLAVMVAAAGVFFLLSMAVRYDRNWLAGLAAFVMALLILVAVHALLFLGVWTYTETTGSGKPSTPPEPPA